MQKEKSAVATAAAASNVAGVLQLPSRQRRGITDWERRR
jgi:hypothetical protein